jgi:hypothetical protein
MLSSCLSFIAWWKCEVWNYEIVYKVINVCQQYPLIACVFGGKGPSCVGLHGACLLALTLDALNLPLWGTQYKRDH